MHFELFFVKSDDRAALIGLIEQRLASPPDAPGKQPDWGLERSYDLLLANEPKRKLAVSPVWNGWIAVVESKVILDYALLQEISVRLSADVIACQLAGAIDAYGYARCCSGELRETMWLENAPDPLRTLRAYLRKHDIPYDLISFRETIQLRNAGWAILQRAGSR